MRLLQVQLAQYMNHRQQIRLILLLATAQMFKNPEALKQSSPVVTEHLKKMGKLLRKSKAPLSKYANNFPAPA
jgi:hypothetical protein